MDVKEAIRILSKKTSESAVSELKYYSGFNRDAVIQKIQEAMDLGAEALEKQMPKKPKTIKVPNTSFTKAHSRCVCTICNARVDDDGRGYEQPYCMECGQALDWSE